MFDLFEKINEFLKETIIGVIRENLASMLIDINDKVGTVAGEVGKTPSAWNSEVFSFIQSINESVVLPVAAMILTAILCIELIQSVVNKNNLHDVVFYKRSYSNKDNSINIIQLSGLNTIIKIKQYIRKIL